MGFLKKIVALCFFAMTFFACSQNVANFEKKLTNNIVSPQLDSVTELSGLDNEYSEADLPAQEADAQEANPQDADSQEVNPQESNSQETDSQESVDDEYDYRIRIPGDVYYIYDYDGDFRFEKEIELQVSTNPHEKDFSNLETIKTELYRLDKVFDDELVKESYIFEGLEEYDNKGEYIYATDYENVYAIHYYYILKKARSWLTEYDMSFIRSGNQIRFSSSHPFSIKLKYLWDGNVFAYHGTPETLYDVEPINRNWTYGNEYTLNAFEDSVSYDYKRYVIYIWSGSFSNNTTFTNGMPENAWKVIDHTPAGVESDLRVYGNVSGLLDSLDENLENVKYLFYGCNNLLCDVEDVSKSHLFGDRYNESELNRLMKGCVYITSSAPFTLKANKGWSGRMYVKNTNTLSGEFEEWNGEEVSSVEILGKHYIFIRGLGNTKTITSGERDNAWVVTSTANDVKVCGNAFDLGHYYPIPRRDENLMLNLEPNAFAHLFADNPDIDVSNFKLPVLSVAEKDGIFMQKSLKPASSGALKFTSANPFSLSTANKTKNWDGKIEYLSSTGDWTEWTGNQISSTMDEFAAIGSSDSQYYICLRGSGNTYLTGGKDDGYCFKNSYFAKYGSMDVGVNTVARNARWVLSGSNINIKGDIRILLDYEDVSNAKMADKAFAYLFANNNALTGSLPSLPARKLSYACYDGMFSNCEYLTSVPEDYLSSALELTPYCYRAMFAGCNRLANAPNLPSTSLALSCYKDMFINCAFTTAPKLPATVLAPWCYSSMFAGCDKLTTVPLIAAEEVGEYSCARMFYFCTSLKDIPSILSATTVKEGSYRGMFEACRSLKAAPKLPATTLAPYCYASMFYACDGLITPSALPAIRTADYCYSYMYYGCHNLSALPCLEHSLSATGAFEYMFYNCSRLECELLVTHVSEWDGKFWIRGYEFRRPYKGDKVYGNNLYRFSFPQGFYVSRDIFSDMVSLLDYGHIYSKVELIK